MQKDGHCPFLIAANVGRIGEEAVFIAPKFSQRTTAD